MFALIRKLHRTRLLTVAGLWHLLRAVRTTGINLMTLLRIAGKLHPDRVAVTDDQEQLSYAQLGEQAESLAVALHIDYGICSQQKVAIVCRNHAAGIKAIFAVSRLGAHIFLLNPEMSADQLLALADRLQFDFVIYDEPLARVFKNSSLKDRSLPTYHPIDLSIDRISSSPRSKQVQLEKVQAGNIVVMTGGTTGQPKSASRKPSMRHYLPLLFAFLTQAHLDQYHSVYIATPICHGYALSFLFVGVALGFEMYFTERFSAARACSLVATHQIQAMIVVPLILQRMLKLDPSSLSSLQCIITGSALLRPALAQEALGQFGPILFNLYGSSEAGFSIMATPDVLGKKPDSIGKPVPGVRAKIVDASGRQVGENTVGQVCIRSAWSSNRNSWIETGDLAYRDTEGDIFLCGRVDDMIVSGGENVYPIELENILTRHPNIDSVAVFGIPDQEFGQRLKAVVVRKRDTTLNQATLLDWLKPRVARYQMPAIIEFRDELPHTSIGKRDKKSFLRRMSPPSPTGVTNPTELWVGTWGTAPQLVEPNNMPPEPGLNNNTLRQVVRISLGGSRLRARFSNEFGTSPVTLNAVHIAASAGGSAIDPNTDQALRFDGELQVIIQPGTAIESDPFQFALEPRTNISITIHFGDTSPDVTGHPGSRTTSYLLPGNEVSSAGFSGAVQTDHWYIINGIDVVATEPAAAVVILGNSVTDGRGSGTNKQNRWTDELARRLQENPDTRHVAVLNMGIGGNCVLCDCLGPTALSRFERDVIEQTRARWLIILEGVNDIGQAEGAEGATAATGDLIAAYEQMTDRAHAEGIRVYGATLLPFGGSFYSTEDREKARKMVNEWIRSSGCFDAVIDLDVALRDPENLLRLLPAADTGDHLHPNETGHWMIAEAVDLTLFG